LSLSPLLHLFLLVPGPRMSSTWLPKITFIKRLAFESYASVSQVIKNGTIANVPFTLKDVTNAEKIYGPLVPAIKGKSVARQINLHDAAPIDKLQDKHISLDIDIFYCVQFPFLLSLSDPIKLCVVDLLTKGDKSFSNLSKVVSDHLSLYRSEGYYVNSVSTDNEPAMMALRHVIQGAGARHVTGGVKSNNLAKIDRHIRLIKDRVRSILHSLPYSLPRKLIPWEVYFAVSRINLLNHSFYKGW
jgi:hypothetical protein